MTVGDQAWSDASSLSDEVDPRRWWILLVLCLSLFMVIMGNTVVNIALPKMSVALNASGSELQWIIDAYSLVFAGLLFTTGSLGDRFGRKGALNFGLVVFGGASVLASFSDSALFVIGCRAAMGLGAAFVMPATLSILTHVFPPQERAKAIGVWAGVAGAAGAIGPIASGWLLEHFYWGSVFWLNVPVVLLALGAGYVLVPTSRHPDRVPLDPIGALISIGMIGALIYGVIEAPVYGWLAGRTLVMFIVAAVLLAAFIVWEHHATHPMLDLALFRKRGFTGGSVAISMTFLGMFGMFFILTLYLQMVRDYSALEAGVRTLPFAFVMMIAAPSAASLVVKFGSRVVIAAGMAVSGIGLLMLGQTSTMTSSYWLLAISLMVLAAGAGVTMAPSTASIMSSLPQEKAGVGSAMNDTTRELGGALGIAVLGSVLATNYRQSVEPALGGIAPDLVDRIGGSLGEALRLAPQLGPGAADVIHAARLAYLDGMAAALSVGGVAAIVGAVIVWLILPKQTHEQPQLERVVAEGSTT